MADILISIDDLGVVHIEGYTEAGEQFVERYTAPNMQVIDAGIIALPMGQRDDFISAAMKEGLTIDA